MQVRRLQPDESSAYREMRLRALADAPDAFGATYADEVALSEEEWRSRADRPDSAIFVVDGPDGIVAMASGGPAPPDIPNVAALYGMWVAPEARRQGLGRALIDAVKDWAIEAGYPVLGLGVTTTNASAIALYERMGFADTGDRYPLRGDTDLRIQIMGTPLTGRAEVP